MYNHPDENNQNTYPNVVPGFNAAPTQPTPPPVQPMPQMNPQSYVPPIPSTPPIPPTPPVSPTPTTPPTPQPNEVIRITPENNSDKESPKREEKKKKPITMGKVIAVCLAFSMAAAVVSGAIVFMVMKYLEKETIVGDTAIFEGKRELAIIDINEVDTSKIMTPAEVYATNVNSTVGITTSVTTTNFWGYQTTSPASGSGFVLTEDGYILTNHHVFEGSDSVSVTFYDGTNLPAEIIGYDKSNDIAVLKVNAENLKPVVLGDSDNMNVGDEVIAIGNPLGELTFTLTAGAVSALDREVTTSSGVTMNLMQTDCAINSGNSGGALFNLYGEVIGITNAKYSSNSSSEASIDNIGFAIPVNSIRGIVTSIIEKGYIAKPYIGVSVGDVSSETQSYGLPNGAAIKEVAKDSPAEEAGLEVNDIITHVDGEAIESSSALVKIISNKSAGDKLKLTVYRQGETLELELTVSETVQSATSQNNNQQSDSGSSGSSGIPGIPWPFGDFGF